MSSFEQVFEDYKSVNRAPYHDVLFYLHWDRTTNEYTLKGDPFTTCLTLLPTEYSLVSYPFTDWSLLPTVQSHDIQSDLFSLGIKKVCLVIDKNTISDPTEAYNRAMKIIGH